MSEEQTAYDQLSAKHRKFVDLYLSNGMVAWTAYQDAGYGGEDPSYDALRANASRLLASADVQAAIQEKLEAHAMSAHEALARLTDMGRASMRPFIRIDDDGRVWFDFSHPEAKDSLHLIRKVKTKRKELVEGQGEGAEVWQHEWVEVELHDAKDALKEVLRYYERAGAPDGSEDQPFVVKVLRGASMEDL